MAEHEQGERQVAPDARRPGRGITDQRQARIAQSGASSPQQPDPDRDEDRQDHEQDQEPGRQEFGVHGNRPSQASEAMPADQQQEQPGAREQRGDLHRLGLDHQPRVDRVVDRAQLVGVVGGVVGAVGDVGDLAEHRLVELAVDLEALDLERRPGGAADADRVDPHATVGRGRGGLQRIGPLVVLAVAQQDDRGRGVRAVGHRRRRRGRVGIGRTVRVVAGRRVVIGGLDRRQRGEDPAGQRGAALRVEPVDGRQDQCLVVGRDLDGEAAVAEGDHADQHRGRLALDEASCRGLGRLHPGRREVVGRHAARDVEREDDRPLDARHADDALRPGHRQDEDRQTGDEQRRGDPPSETTARRRAPAAGARRPRPTPPPAPPANVPKSAIRRRRRRSRTTYSATPIGMVSARSSIGGQMNDMASAAAASEARPSARSPRPGPRRSTARRRRPRSA